MSLAERVAALVRPHPSLQAHADQQRARLAAGLLLAMMAIGLPTLLLPNAAASSFWTGRGLLLGLLATLAGSFLLVRRGQVSAGVVLTLAALVATVAVSRLEATTHDGGQLVLAFLVIPILLAGILLPVRLGAAFAVLTFVGVAVFEANLDQRLGTATDEKDLSFAVLLTAVSVLAVVASSMSQRQARQLHESEQVLRQLAENIPEVFFVVAADFSKMHYTSPAYLTVVGRRVEEAMADPLDWIKAVHPDDLPRVRAQLAANESMLEYRAVMPSGAIKHLRARTFPVLGAGGKPVSLVGIAEDVTEARRAQEQLREAQQQRIHLLQQLAHDLASPLTPIKIQLLLLKDRVGPQGRQGLEVLRRNIDHLERLVADVRDVARLEGGELRIDRREVDVVALAQEAVQTIGLSAAERKVAVAIEAPLALNVEADPGRLTQVLYNLVGNALKFTPAGGTVTLSIAREGDTVRIDVRDTGAGMRPDQLARLFKPFSQVHDPATIQSTADKGTGLGLFISKGLVEAHGGQVSARSAGPGLGSTFTVVLPMVAPK